MSACDAISVTCAVLYRVIFSVPFLSVLVCICALSLSCNAGKSRDAFHSKAGMQNQVLQPDEQELQSKVCDNVAAERQHYQYTRYKGKA